jgi:hypothetical protein
MNKTSGTGRRALVFSAVGIFVSAFAMARCNRDESLGKARSAAATYGPNGQTVSTIDIAPGIDLSAEWSGCTATSS